MYTYVQIDIYSLYLNFFPYFKTSLYQCDMFNHEIYPHPESINFSTTWHSWTQKNSEIKASGVYICPFMSICLLIK